MHMLIVKIGSAYIISAGTRHRGDSFNMFSDNANSYECALINVRCSKDPAQKTAPEERNRKEKG